MIFRPDLFKGIVVMVTGGATGIGASIAHLFSSLGARVIIASRKKERIDKAAAGLTTLTGNPVEGMVCNIRDREQVQQCLKNIIEKYGALHVLVNNGGGQYMSPAANIRPKGWDAVLETNLTGTWTLCQEAAKLYMLKNGGRIINITMLTDRGFPGMAHSCAARAGVEGLTKTLAVEWASKNITINCIQPGIIASNGIRNYPGWKGIVRQSQS